MTGLLFTSHGKYSIKLSNLKCLFTLPIIFLCGCATIYEGGTHYIDDKNCLSCGYALVALFKWGKEMHRNTQICARNT